MEQAQYGDWSLNSSLELKDSFQLQPALLTQLVFVCHHNSSCYTTAPNNNKILNGGRKWSLVIVICTPGTTDVSMPFKPTILPKTSLRLQLWKVLGQVRQEGKSSWWEGKPGCALWLLCGNHRIGHVIATPLSVQCLIFRYSLWVSLLPIRFCVHRDRERR